MPDDIGKMMALCCPVVPDSEGSVKNHTPPVLGSANPAIAMICAAPKRDAPAALQLP